MSDKFQKLDNKLVGQTIKSLRKTKKISITQFSEQTGICRSYITMVEQGDANPSLDVISALFAGLGKQIVFGIKRNRSNSLRES